jgi:Zn-dependent M28 family amino/carboxypeptidase
VGSGIVNNSRDDYNGLNVKDKWVMMDEGNPFFARQKVTLAKQKGAKGVILVTKNLPRKAASELKGRMTLSQAVSTSEFPAIAISYRVASAFYERSIRDSASLFKINIGTAPTQADISVSKTKLTLQSSNVLAVLEGSDKKDEYILITSHYDHLGKRDTVIYYGADDDGSGTTSVIEIAEAFAEAKKKGNGPRRNIVFMTVSGEEKGLLGSEYYANHPVYPLDKTSVDLNIDMVGRIDPKFKDGGKD